MSLFTPPTTPLLAVILAALFFAPLDGSAATGQSASVQLCVKARELETSSRLEEAIALYTKCMETSGLQNEVLSGILVNRAHLYSVTGQADKALADYDRAIALDRSNSMAYNNRANALKGKGRYDDAIADYTRAIELNPRNAMIYNNRATVYKNKDMYERSVADLDKAIELAPQNVVAYYNRACLEAVRGNAEAACSWLAKAFEKGFTERELMKADKDFEKIRNAACFTRLLQEK
jgi:tetratricopeptide (TPR) repeat protein